MKIQVNTLKKDIKDLVAIGEQVSKIPQGALFTNQEGDLIDALLSIFDFGELHEGASVEEKARLITGKVYIHKEVAEAALPKMVDSKSINKFLFYVIGFKRLPHEELYDLFQLVSVDLQGMIALMERYEADQAIKGYLEGAVRHEHEAMVRIEYYKRCLKERDFILQYLSEGMYRRALSNICAPVEPAVRNILSKEYRDRPYFFRKGQTLAYFDYTQINIYRHRIEDLDHGVNTFKVNELGHLYENGMVDKFYEVLNGLRPATELFQKIRELYSRALPILHERMPIFQEMEELFLSGKWYGFSALALIQVEGLFSDMMTVSTPRRNAGSLSMKVRMVRPFYPYYGVGMDYFEFELPRIRNRLLHHGNMPEHNFRILSCQLAYDLWYLLDFSLRLSDPSSRLNAICNSAITPEYVGAVGLVRIFDYVQKIQDQVKRNTGATVQQGILIKWKDFRIRLADANGLLDLVRDMRVILRGDITRSFAAVKRESAMLFREIDLATLSAAEVAARKEEIASIVQGLSSEVKEELGDVYHSLRFLHCYKSYLPECEPSPQQALDAIKNVHRDTWAKLQQFKEVIEDCGYSHSAVF